VSLAAVRNGGYLYCRISASLSFGVTQALVETKTIPATARSVTRTPGELKWCPPNKFPITG